MTDVQVERAFQRQEMIAFGRKRQAAKAKGMQVGRSLRFWKNIGLGFETPREAITGTFVDNKCPFTSRVAIRGRLMNGVVHSTKMKRTVVVRRDYLHFVPKYNRYEKRHTNISAHCSPAFHVVEGDRVVIGQCRPLSKTVRFNVVKVESHDVKTKKEAKQAAKKQFKPF
eukprot:m51a1_g3520 putative 40S ribosomal protein S17 (169) ;mRNA; f:915307-915959